MIKPTRLLPYILPLFIFGCSSHPTIKTDKAHHQATKHTKLQLDDTIRPLLRQEMQAIQSGMMALMPAIASGNWQKVSEIGNNMQHSYIMKQQLTKKQRHALHRTLPKSFIKKDKAFHKAAGMLAHAAEEGHPDVVNFYVYKLASACVECHSEFATERFPNFKLNPQHSAHDTH